MNTGNVEAEFTVEFAWLMGDGSRVQAAEKTMTLRPGRSRLVFFRKTGISTAAAGNFQDHPGYFDGDNCRTKASFGAA